MRLGAHMSISGGVEKAVVRGQEVGCEAIQIFTKNSNQWKAKPLTPTEITVFRDACEAAGIGPVIAHSAYLINLAAPDEALYEKSIQAFLDELQRCELLGIPYLVVHPGAHIGQGYIGTQGVEWLLNDRRLAKLPMVLETPKDDDADVRNLATLRNLIR